MSPFVSTRHARVNALFVLVWLIAFPLVAEADEVRLKNGDRLTGRIVRMEGDQLFMESDQAGDVYIDWENVKSLSSPKPLSVRFQRGAAIPENVGIRDGDRIIVLKLEDGGPVNLATVRSINQADLYTKGHVSIGGNVTTGNTDTSALNSSLEWLVRRTGSAWSVQEAGVANAREPGARLAGGDLVKVAMDEPYRP